MRVLIIVMLIGVLNMLYFEMASAEITIDSGTVLVETDNYEVQFDRGVITYIHNKLTAETYTLPEDHRAQGVRERTGILRRHHGHIWTRDMTIAEAKKTGQDRATLLFRQGGNEITLTIEVELHTGDLLIGGSGVSDIAGVYGFQWGCGGLDIQNLELILPAHGGQVINASSPFTAKEISVSRSLGGTTCNSPRSAGRLFRPWGR